MTEIKISIASQQLTYTAGVAGIKTYRISTSLKGAGQKFNSGMTPLGEHIIRAKIGQCLPVNSVFVGRRPTGEIFTPGMMDEFPGRDWILSRILWLSGKQVGYNRLGDVDTMRRYIYIHGTPYEDQLGKPVSHGCVRMSNMDIVDLFSRVEVGCFVSIRHEF